MANPPELVVEQTVVIQATPARVLDAFFRAEDLQNWWQVLRSVTVPRPLGTFSVEWPSTEYRDDVLGRLGGAFHGTVIDYRSGREFFIGEAYWQPPEGEPIGPMALRCAAPRKGAHIRRACTFGKAATTKVQMAAVLRSGLRGMEPSAR